MATKKLCSIPACRKPHHSSDLCSTHYSRLVRNGDVNAFAPRKLAYLCEETGEWVPKRCSVESCEKPMKARQMCSMHLRRVYQYGDPQKGAMVPAAKDCSVDGCGNPAASRWKRKIALCNKHYLRMLNHGSTDAPSARSERPAICSVEDCKSPHMSLGYCEKHYARLYRHRKAGRVETPERVRPRERYFDLHGYVVVYVPGHPLTEGKRGNYEREHRVVFYDNHGSGPFKCHHCDVVVTWADMHVDHLNTIVDDNHPGNLVPSCAECNKWRGRGKMRATMVEKYSTSATFNGVTKTHNEWAKSLGISRQSLIARLENGWSPEKAFTTPRGNTGPKVKKIVA